MEHVQGSVKEWSLGCVIPASLPALATGAHFTQPRDHSLANPCTRHARNKYEKLFCRCRESSSSPTSLPLPLALPYSVSSLPSPPLSPLSWPSVVPNSAFLFPSLRSRTLFAPSILASLDDSWQHFAFPSLAAVAAVAFAAKTPKGKRGGNSHILRRVREASGSDSDSVREGGERFLGHQTGKEQRESREREGGRRRDRTSSKATRQGRTDGQWARTRPSQAALALLRGLLPCLKERAPLKTSLRRQPDLGISPSVGRFFP